MAARSRFRWAWWLLAYVSLGLGIIGAFLPLMPTTVFILIAAYAAARGSDKLHRRLLEHRLFGPMIRDWQAGGAVSRRAKYLAVGSMAVCAVVLVVVTPWWASAAGTTCMAIVGTWLWLRPEPSADAAPAPTSTGPTNSGPTSTEHARRDAR